MKHIALGLVIGIAFSALLLGCTDKQQATEVVADIEAGKALAEANCKGCHGLDGKGAAPGIPHLAVQRASYLYASLQAYKSGQRKHAALQDITTTMSDQDMRNVAGFYADLEPVPSAVGAETPLSPYDKGMAATKTCVECHGEDGNSIVAGVPSLAGQQPRYFVAATQAYLDGSRDIESMESMLRGLSKIEMENMAVYYASQTPVQRPAPEFGEPSAGQPLSAVCGGCHGANGISRDTNTPNLAGQDAGYLVNAVKAYRDGSRRHTDMRALLTDSSDQGIENIAAFYATQTPKAAETPIKSDVQQLADKCNRCHVDSLDSPGMKAPKLSGQDKDYLVMALRAYQDGKRDSSMMHKMSLPYSDAIIDSIASWYAGQPLN